MNRWTRRRLLGTGLAAGASTLCLPAWAGVPGGPVAAPGREAVEAGRSRQRLDLGWRFFQGHGSDPARDLGFGATQQDFAKSGEFGFARVKFDDSGWRALNLPHDWAIELPYVHDESLQGHGYKPLGRRYPETSVGWYRRRFELAPSDAGRRVRVDFDGAFRSALVFLNGYFIGRNDNGYAPFSFDISDYANFGGSNALTVRMDASFGDGWFYEGAGIYRHVWLSTSAPLHLAQWSSFVRTEVQAESARLELGTLVRNEGTALVSAHVRWEIFDAAGERVATAESEAQGCAPDSETSFAATARLARPQLWSPESPALYTAQVSVLAGGQTVDSEPVRFGVRTVHFDVDKGFFLNGKPRKIQGTCNHQDHAGVGAALPDALQRYRVGVLQQMGCNAVRTSHNMPTPEWVEACDRMGMMMMCETRNEASTPEGLEQLSAMVRRYRNSPSILLWSIGNEESVLQREAAGERVGASMVRLCHELDPTRLCTAAVNNSYGTGISRALDVEGFNYNLGEIAPYHAKHPEQPLIGTETASTVATRGVYETDTLRNWVSAYDRNYPPWASTAESWWKVYGTREYLPGGFAWTGFDYRGEPTPYGWPSICSQFGIVDLCGFPKDDFYYYRAWWRPEPSLHLFPHWNWEQRLGEPIDVWVHANVEEVELVLNGRSLGVKKVEPLGHLEWSVPYEPGVLEARGRAGGKVVLTERRETTGPVAEVRLSADRTSLSADGQDCAMIRVEAFDAAGRAVPTAGDHLRFEVSGAGRLLGVGNGDPNCQEPEVFLTGSPQRSLFNGLAQLIVQAGEQPGGIEVSAWGDGHHGAKLARVSLKLVAQAVG